MKKNEKSTVFRMNVGGASIILILVVIAMCIFAILSVRASYNELKLARNSKEYITDYYAADTASEKAYGLAAEKYAETGSLEAAAAELTSDPEGSVSDYTVEDGCIKYLVSVDDGRSIETVLEDIEGVLRRTSQKLTTETLEGYGTELFDQWEMLETPGGYID